MAVTPEGRVKAEIKAYLNSIGAYWFMPVQTGYGTSTVDFLVCYRGYFIAIEAKAPGKMPTKFQELTMEKIRKAGGKVYVVHDMEELIGIAGFNPQPEVPV